MADISYNFYDENLLPDGSDMIFDTNYRKLNPDDYCDENLLPDGSDMIFEVFDDIIPESRL